MHTCVYTHTHICKWNRINENCKTYNNYLVFIWGVFILAESKGRHRHSNQKPPSEEASREHDGSSVITTFVKRNSVCFNHLEYLYSITVNFWDCLYPHIAKCHQQIGSLDISWELVKNTAFWTPPRLVTQNQHQHFKEIPSVFTCTITVWEVLADSLIFQVKL